MTQETISVRSRMILSDKSRRWCLFKFIVSNSFISNRFDQAVLFLIVPVRCAMNTEQTDVKAGSTVVLNCTTNTVGNTSTVWQWYHNAVLLATQEKRYIISSATRKHMGMYQCCSMDADRCCAQTQIRVISKKSFLRDEQSSHRNV